MTQERKQLWLGVLNVVSPVTVITAIFWAGVYSQEFTGRLFDTIEQKNKVIEFYEGKHPVSYEDVYKIETHMSNQTVHTNLEEKKLAETIKERQSNIIAGQKRIEGKVDKIIDKIN